MYIMIAVLLKCNTDIVIDVEILHACSDLGLIAWGVEHVFMVSVPFCEAKSIVIDRWNLLIRIGFM